MRIRGMVVAVAAFILFTLLNTTPVEAAGGRRVKLDDMNLLRSVGGVQVSPDGKWIAYTVTGIDVEKDKSNTDIWMTSWDGKRTLMMTTSPDSESSPRFSPDGRYLSFLSSRNYEDGTSLSSRNYEDETSQVWLLPRRGGEAERITDIKGGVVEVACTAPTEAFRIRTPEEDA